MKIFLIDFGSTFVKYAVYDTLSRQYILAEKLPFPSPSVCREKRFEVPESSIRELVFSAFDTAAGNGCSRAYISVQMHGYLLGTADKSVTNYVSWRDQTGDIQGITADFSVRGTSKKANLPFVKLYRGKHEGEEFYTLGSYIAYLLTGRNQTHKTDACASGFFNAQTLTSPENLGFTLPEISDKVIPIGMYRGILIYTPVGDHQASYLGSDAGEDEYLINIGTATQISCLTQNPTLNDGCELRPYIEDGMLMTVTGLTGGSELHSGVSPEKLCSELADTFDILPKRSKAVIGGGASNNVYDSLCRSLAEHGISCRAAKPDIGLEGLRMIADSQRLLAGIMLSEAAFTNFPIILKNTGMDFYIIDCEHGAFDYHTLSELLVKSRLMGIKAIVRIGDNRREFITKLADMGASGFLLSMTNTSEDIEEVVRYAKYSPIGKRGISTTRAHTLYAPPSLREYMANANREMKIYAQIETELGVLGINEILNVNGVDGVFIGPNDLSDDLNCIGDNAPIKNCITAVAHAANKSGKPWGIITANEELTAHSMCHGVNMISCQSELNLLIDGCKHIIKKFN